jgi:hypothetical protein
MSFLKKHSDYIILLLLALVLGLLLIILTDIHVAKINRKMEQTALFNPLNPLA